MGSSRWWSTNVPYLGRGKQDNVLKDHCEKYHSAAKADIATCFVERCLAFCVSGGGTAIVTPQGWLFLANYEKLRESLLKKSKWCIASKLGVGAFGTIGGEVVNIALVILSQAIPNASTIFLGIDVSDAMDVNQKASHLYASKFELMSQLLQLKNPDSRIILDANYDANQKRLGNYCVITQGSSTGDDPKFVRTFWESLNYSRWKWFMSSPDAGPYSGRSLIWDWPNEKCELCQL